MQTIIIDEEFKSLLPGLDKETFELLEENILQNGCRDSLVLWGDILIDGHNRYAVCTKHDIPFNTINKDFSSREEALIWIITTQVSRRNLSPIQLSYFRGLHYRADRKIVTNADGKNQYTEVGSQNGNQPKSPRTIVKLANQYNVSKNTIHRDSKVADAIDAIGETSPETKRMILAGEVKINKKVLEELSSTPMKEVSEFAESIENGAYEKQKPERLTPAEEADSPGYDRGAANTDGPFTIDNAIDRIADDLVFYAQLRALANSGDTTELRRALRFYIDMLEDLYEEL